MRITPIARSCIVAASERSARIHGRVFFAKLALDSVQAWIATVESVVGIMIEGVFVAMVIQRFFGR
jgi:hypothetical protein